MPELPEVETIRQQLTHKIVGKKLKGRKIVGLRRRGKILIINFDNDSHLIFHLKLTGQLIFNGKPSLYTLKPWRKGREETKLLRPPKGGEETKFLRPLKGGEETKLLRPRKVFVFDDGSQLIFNDLRKFGWYKIVKSLKSIEEKLGPEALEISFKKFKEFLKKRPNSKIKTLLMDQNFIAGIGNIYSSEILFSSKVYPLRRVETLEEQEIKLIYQNIKKILRKAIQCRGTTRENYRDAYGRKGNYSSHLKVYQREGKKCFRCGTIIKRVKQAGRSAYYCPKCQKK